VPKVSNALPLYFQVAIGSTATSSAFQYLPLAILQIYGIVLSKSAKPGPIYSVSQRHFIQSRAAI
jgi:hypothetical protein